MRSLILLLTIVGVLLVGCGQKGPLYRPETDSDTREAEQASGGESGAQAAD